METDCKKCGNYIDDAFENPNCDGYSKNPFYINCFITKKEVNDYEKILSYAGKYCCWVHEYGGYFAYCHKDGRLITRTGFGAESNRTWSSVGNEMLQKFRSR